MAMEFYILQHLYPLAECSLIRENSILVSFVGLVNISAGVDNFPMSWMVPAMRIPSIFSCVNPISVAMAKKALKLGIYNRNE
jgi:hypothetical protein